MIKPPATKKIKRGRTIIFLSGNSSQQKHETLRVQRTNSWSMMYKQIALQTPSGLK